MVDFTGVYDCSIDNKGRVIIPAPLKRQLQPFSDKTMMLKRSIFAPCLELYVMEEWTKLSVIINKLNPFIPKNNEFKRLFSAGVKEVSIDQSGRLLIAKDLLVFSKISKEVTMASAGNYIEIWNKEFYEKQISVTPDAFSKLAEEVMKDKFYTEEQN